MRRRGNSLAFESFDARIGMVTKARLESYSGSVAQ